MQRSRRAFMVLLVLVLGAIALPSTAGADSLTCFSAKGTAPTGQPFSLTQKVHWCSSSGNIISTRTSVRTFVQPHSGWSAWPPSTVLVATSDPDSQGFATKATFTWCSSIGEPPCFQVYVTVVHVIYPDGRSNFTSFVIAGA